MDATSLPQELRAVLLLLAAVIVSVLLVLLRRLAFRWLLRPLARGLRAVWARLRGLLRFLRLGSRAAPRQKPAKGLLGLSVGAIAEAFTETDDAIAEGLDKSKIAIETQSRFACTWIRPTLEHSADYHRDDAEEDFARAKQLFSATVPIESNALNLYDDIHNAFIVRLIGDSDRGFFFILTEFRRAINANVLVLAGIFSFIVSLVAVLNVTVSGTAIDFYRILNLERVDGLKNLGIGVDEANKALFGLVSCALGWLLMWMYYHMAYDQAQRHNGREMDRLLLGYLANISNRFNRIHAHATQAVVGDANVDEMKRETLLWITNLHWMALRVFFVEEFLRGILFQIRRNSIYALFLVPAFFIFLMIATAWLFGVDQLNIRSWSESDLYRQNSFYVLFPLLLYAYYKYLIESLKPMEDSVQANWWKFRDLSVVDSMSRIMEAYAEQLDQWRSRYNRGAGGAM